MSMTTTNSPDSSEAMSLSLAHGIIVCPGCHGVLTSDACDIICTRCQKAYPSVDGIPILLHAGSAFTPEQLVSSGATYFSRRAKESRLKRTIRQGLPALATDYGRLRCDELVRSSLAVAPRPLRGFLCGAGENPHDIETRFPEVEWLTSDVDLSYRPHLIADALALPIADGSQDLVIAEMVLEHIMDIVQAAQEVQRICRTGGLVLIKVPFCFPWHGIPCDFFRCTPSGLRALFRSAETVFLGECMGPWGALAYQLDASLMRVSSVRALRWAAAFLSRFLFGWLKWFDLPAEASASRLVTTAGLTFIGRKRDSPYSSREIMAELRARFANGAL